MSSTEQSNFEPLDPLDRAVADRLSQLRTMPIELSALRRAVDGQVSEISPPSRRERRVLSIWPFTPLRAIAASLLVGGLALAIVVAISSGPVMASPDRMAEIHLEVMSGDAHAEHKRVAVNTIESANRALSAENPKAPTVPGVGQEQVMSCCLHAVGRKKISCVALAKDGEVVSVAVADASDVKIPASQTVVVDGVLYHLQSARGINMVMTARCGRWVCLMAKLPAERLIDLAKVLQF